MKTFNVLTLTTTLVLLTATASHAQFKKVGAAKAAVNGLMQLVRSGKITQALAESTRAVELFKAQGQASGGTRFVLFHEEKEVKELIALYNNRTIFVGVQEAGTAPDQYIRAIQHIAGEVPGAKDASFAIAEATNYMSKINPASYYHQPRVREFQVNARNADVYVGGEASATGTNSVQTFTISGASRDIEVGANQANTAMNDIYEVVSGRISDANRQLAATSKFSIREIAIQASSKGTKGL